MATESNENVREVLTDSPPKVEGLGRSGARVGGEWRVGHNLMEFSTERPGREPLVVVVVYAHNVHLGRVGCLLCVDIIIRCRMIVGNAIVRQFHYSRAEIRERVVGRKGAAHDDTVAKGIGTRLQVHVGGMESEALPDDALAGGGARLTPEFDEVGESRLREAHDGLVGVGEVHESRVETLYEYEVVDVLEYLLPILLILMFVVE